MLGVPGRRVDRLLQVHAGMDVAQEELRDPLVLLVAAGRAPGEIRLAVAQGQGRRQRGARPLARRQRGRMAFLEPEHLARVPRQKPSSGMTGEDCSQPPDGVDETMLPALSMMSKCTVSPRTSPMRPTVGSPAPMAPTAARWPSARRSFTTRAKTFDLARA